MEQCSKKEYSMTQQDQSSDEPTQAAETGNSTSTWRTLWRIHFYSGIFALPFIVLMAITGLVILYTQPIQEATQASERIVAVPAGISPASLDKQAAAVEAAYPDGKIGDLTIPARPDQSTRFFVDDGSKSGIHVFVNPYTSTVLGSHKPGDDVVGLANRLHGHLNNDALTVPLPAVAALWDGGAVMRDYVVGDLVLEMLGIWTLVLVFSGLYIWWPRRSATMPRRSPFIRKGTTGRARWRDLHGTAGVILLPLMALTIVSGLAWSTYWSGQFSSLADKLTPGEYVDQPASSLGVRGDLDRFGNQIPWNTGDFPIPSSYAPVDDGTQPAPLSLDAVAAIAREVGMRPGYTISLPSNTPDEAGNTVYGSFALYNSWPRKTGEARDVFLDQFSGATLAEQRVYGNGTIARGMDYLVSTHMGTQLGLVSRIFMTALCLLAIWSVVSAVVMYTKRRRPGTAGLPRRPASPHLSRALWGIFIATGLVFPHWFVVALVILGLDRFVIQRVQPLRRAFGQH